MPEEETPEHVKKYSKLKKKAGQIIETTAHEHRKAYLTAQDKHLRDEEGLVDYELLEKPEIQEAFVKTMAEHYISKAKQALSVGKEKLDELEEDLLMNAYAGITKQELKHYVGQHGKDFTFEVFDKRHPEYMERITKVLHGAAGQHLKEGHIDDLLKDAKASDLVESKYITLDQAKVIHGLYEEQGTVSRKMLESLVRRGILPKRVLKKKEK